MFVRSMSDGNWALITKRHPRAREQIALKYENAGHSVAFAHVLSAERGEEYRARGEEYRARLTSSVRHALVRAW